MITFDKILIANRGEIALRVMRTCRQMGISTVAVYSDADARALHVRFADEAVHIGAAASKDSYLNIEKIIEAGSRSGARAIHPGYGFLSENADFAEACESAGMTFIGPSPDAIRKAAVKSTARRIMAGAGVPVVPGYDGEEQSAKVLRGRAEPIGMPLLIKASAGGGGRGMRIVREPRELDEAIEAARREAEKAFGDGDLLLEKYVEGARHIEVQILGDKHGNLIHLYERECSIQRRHQKVIEESPSPALNSELRNKICAAALEAGRSIDYTNAGTVEFILTPTAEFYFIEVNTRLQVEHPVTEMITGVDLVRLQIEIAAGNKLSLKQEEIRQAGHAIEARLYAEDPNIDFLPAAGTLLEWCEPESVEGLRIDAGVDRGAEVGIHYDPMLAKVIAHAADRESARRKLIRGLSQLFAPGVQTNREFLINTIDHPQFASGRFHTGFIADHIEELTVRGDPTEDLVAAVVVAVYIDALRQADAEILPGLPPHYRNNPFRDPSIRLQVQEQPIDVSWKTVGDGGFAMSCGDWQSNVRV